MRKLFLALLLLYFPIAMYGNNKKQKIEKQQEKNQPLEVVVIKNKDIYINNLFIENTFINVKIFSFQESLEAHIAEVNQLKSTYG